MTPISPRERPVGVAVVGTGFGRNTQLPAFRANPNCRVVAVLSHSEEKARATANEFQIPNAFGPGGYDEMLRTEGLDLVCVSSPPDSHRDYSIRALAAGKHVLCEKPTAMNATEARAMRDAAAAAPGRLALLDHELRFDTARRFMRDRVREGALGRLYHVTLDVESEFRLDATRGWSWWSDAARGGGVLGAIGSHVVDAIRFTFGEPVRGRAVLRTWIQERNTPEGKCPVTADDFVAFWLELEGGALVTVRMSTMSRSMQPGWRMTAHGSDASVHLEADGRVYERRAAESAYAERTPPQPPFDAKALGMPDTMWARAFVVYAREIVEAIRSGAPEIPLAATFEDGLRAQEVLDELRASV
jgi:predicted dehydrogenase